MFLWSQNPVDHIDKTLYQALDRILAIPNAGDLLLGVFQVVCEDNQAVRERKQTCLDRGDLVVLFRHSNLRIVMKQTRSERNSGSEEEDGEV
jgi:hypothetical protein